MNRRTPKSKQINFRLFRVVRGLNYYPFNLCLRVISKIHQKSKLHICCLQVIEELRPVFISQVAYCFDFNDYFSIADEIRLVYLLEKFAFIFQFEFIMRDEWDIAAFKFLFKTFLVNSFKETASHFPVNFEYGSLDSVALIFI